MMYIICEVCPFRWVRFPNYEPHGRTRSQVQVPEVHLACQVRTRVWCTVAVGTRERGFEVSVSFVLSVASYDILSCLWTNPAA